MKRIAFLLGGLLFCQSAAAVELLASNFSVDLSRFYFSLDVTDLPQFDASFNLYTASTCAILPPSYERFHFTFDPDGGTITEGPQVTTTGAPALDRWADGPVDHLSLVEVDLGHQREYFERIAAISARRPALHADRRSGSRTCLFRIADRSDTGSQRLP